MRFAALIGATLLVAPAAAREPVKVGNWDVTAFESGCVASNWYMEHNSKKASMLTIGYNSKAKTSVLSFTNSKATSLTDGTKIQLEIFLVNPDGKSDDGWGNKEFTASIIEDGPIHFTSAGLDKEILDDVTKAKMLAFFVDQTLVSSFNLNGSAAAIAELRKCAFEVAGLNPDDPFLK